jgi:hypothetical protein
MSPLHFIDAGANGDEPAKGVTQGHLREWFDQMDGMRGCLRDLSLLMLADIDREAITAGETRKRLLKRADYLLVLSRSMGLR